MKSTVTRSASFSDYYYLTKPGIIKGNLLTVVAGFLFASQNGVKLSNLVGVIAGSSLIIASGCVLNNVIDRNIDKKMTRTKNRAVANGTIKIGNALWFSTTLGILGFTALYALTNTTTIFVGLVGLLSYVVLYSMAKHRTIFGTELGTISGATPILSGYTAVHGDINLVASVLFLSLVIWQLPHFYAISLFRKAEYSAANIHVPSLRSTSKVLERLIIALSAIFGSSGLALWYTDAINPLLAGAIFGIGIWWSVAGYRKLKTSTSVELWARHNFGLSLMALTVYCILLSANALA